MRERRRKITLQTLASGVCNISQCGELFLHMLWVFQQTFGSKYMEAQRDSVTIPEYVYISWWHDLKCNDSTRVLSDRLSSLRKAIMTQSHGMRLKCEGLS